MKRLFRILFFVPAYCFAMQGQLLQALFSNETGREVLLTVKYPGKSLSTIIAINGTYLFKVPATGTMIVETSTLDQGDNLKKTLVVNREDAGEIIKAYFDSRGRLKFDKLQGD